MKIKRFQCMSHIVVSPKCAPSSLVGLQKCIFMFVTGNVNEYCHLISGTPISSTKIQCELLQHTMIYN